MKSNKVIEKIKDVLNLNEEVKLEQAKLDNGTVIEADSFESGVEVFIVTEDEKVALPVGEYALEDGKILVIAEEGVISEIKEEEAEEETEEVEEVEASEEEEKESLGYATKEELAEVKSMIEEIKAMLEPKEDLSEDLSEDLGNLLTEELAKHEKVELNEVPVEVQAELNEPSAEPIVSNPEGNKAISKFSVSKNRKSTTIDRVMARLNN
jgi:hypothetical protein